MKNIVKFLERQVETEELERLGLSKEEIEGYFDFYIETWIEDEKVNCDN